MSEREAFCAAYDVPRETLDKFDRYALLLAEWQTRMNLVGPSTLDAIWTRHFADSAQLANLTPEASADSRWLDLGSGAGFPGLVLALLRPGHFHLVEATTKKCFFLQSVADELGLTGRVSIENRRIEDFRIFDAQFITARACASLTRLLDWGLRHGRRATWLLLKGESIDTEIEAAREHFSFSADLVQSTTDIRGRIVVARDVRRLRP